MQVGKLRHRVELQSPESAQSTSGEEAIVWRGRGSVWAEVSAMGGRELEAARQLHAEVTHKVRIRAKAEVVASWRVKFGDRILGIDAVVPDFRNIETALLCRELTDDEGEAS